MGELRYCPQCKENRYTEVKINWIIAVLLLLLGIIFGVIYIIYCYAKKEQCPYCGTPAKMMEPPHMNEKGSFENQN